MCQSCAELRPTFQNFKIIVSVSSDYLQFKQSLNKTLSNTELILDQSKIFDQRIFNSCQYMVEVLEAFQRILFPLIVRAVPAKIRF